MATFPQASDVILHAKESDKSERIVFPVTRYENIMSSPKMIADISTANDAPFLLLQESSVEIDEVELHNLCGARGALQFGHL